jgi:hypothetical protein
VRRRTRTFCPNYLSFAGTSQCNLSFRFNRVASFAAYGKQGSFRATERVRSEESLSGQYNKWETIA